jgi:tRNA 2-thiouridine synthesizing protein A
VIIDCRGRRCPVPILELARRISDIPVAASITVVADDPAAGPDIRAWCRMRGHEFVGTTPSADGTPGFTVRRLH